jgi:hypothetical protein
LGQEWYAVGDLDRVGARTKNALFEAIGHGLDTITPDDARNWFAHCGYQVEAPLL